VAYNKQGVEMFNKRLRKELSDLRESYTQLRQVSDSIYSEMLVLELDNEGRIQMMNENFLRELGYREADLLCKEIDQLFAPSFRSEPNYQKFRRALQNKEHFCGAFRLIDSKNHEAWLRCIWQPVLDSQGQLLRMAMCAVNLTGAREHYSGLTALYCSD
jgi:methyl-accepting chemotaxis protein